LHSPQKFVFINIEQSAQNLIWGGPENGWQEKGSKKAEESLQEVSFHTGWDASA